MRVKHKRYYSGWERLFGPSARTAEWQHFRQDSCSSLANPPRGYVTMRDFDNTSSLSEFYKNTNFSDLEVSGLSARPSCSVLTREAEDLDRSRQPDHWQLWEFARSWINRSGRGDRSNFERFIYLWVTVNAWAAKTVRDIDRNDQDRYLVHCMAGDAELSERLNGLCSTSASFREDVDGLIREAPIFNALWLGNSGIEHWDRALESRDEFVNRAFRRMSPKMIGKTRAYSPQCYLDHLRAGEKVPADWPHVLHMIYKVRCNLFHGGKSHDREADRHFITLAYRILRRVWLPELPEYVHNPREHRPPQVGMRDHREDSLPWARLLVRSGFRVKSNNGRIMLDRETSSNKRYLKAILDQRHGEFGRVEGEEFVPVHDRGSESTWLATIDVAHSGAETGSASDLAIMDTHMSGLVRWTNEIGIDTYYSCDGHLSRPPCLRAVDESGATLAISLYTIAAKGLDFSQQEDKVVIHRSRDRGRPRLELLDLAEWLHDHAAECRGLLHAMRPLVDRRKFLDDTHV